MLRMSCDQCGVMSPELARGDSLPNGWVQIFWFLYAGMTASHAFCSNTCAINYLKASGPPDAADA